MSEDEIIGLKSTSIKFKHNIKLFVSTTYLMSIFLILYLFKDLIGKNIFSLFLVIYIFSLIVQIFKFKRNQPKKYLDIFKINNFTGFFLFLSIFSLNL